ncbi:Metallo-beta-lactamase superfamily protein [Xylanibacter ruminicola]|uniref:Metallo-beta-lactamase superfamily protein n=1 Tax=Xylanibacter ruminicola TaxID=839 RepID=A0A1H4C5F1_XYLRU|nr:MBL fold metallo-hydrolase [Xylanibacter ruminicola]SEA55523.1 Metallo-beta-lactamase superfamily protein [Xylanibacter ruminicola]
MSKNLYFVDSIYQPIGGGMAVVSLLPTAPNEEKARVEVLQDVNLEMSNYKGRIQEGWYVFCDDNKQFFYGNTTAFARNAFNEYKRLLELTIKRHLTEETREDVSLLNRLKTQQNDIIISYHINVHHGNCSVILLQYGGGYEVWMVDCSLSEKGSGNQFASNLEAAFDEIRKKLGKQPDDKITIRRFFLTHHHADHYAGVEYLVNQGYIDNNTLCFWNIYYHMAGSMYLKTWQALINANVKFIEPIARNSRGAIEFLHPECRLYRSKGTTGVKVKPSRVVGKANNSSTVVKFSLGGKSMVFPGDLERGGFDNMTKKKSCSPKLCGISYYAISHHGSLNGHPDIPCLNPDPNHPRRPMDCISIHNSKAILMGRDGAYPGIYSPVVTSYWGGRNALVKTEDAPHFVELNWGNGNVIMG